MAYELSEIQAGQEIFYYLLEHHELREDMEQNLFRTYTEKEQIQNLVKSQGIIAHANIERYGNVIYLIPQEDNTFMGYSKAQLKSALCKSNGTDRDYYLAQFALLTLLVEFYDGQGATSKTRDFIRVGELQNSISERLKEGSEHMTEEEQNNVGIAFSDMKEAYEALKSDEKGSRARTTKEGFLYNLLCFLQKQGLVDYVVEDEMIQTTKKLDNFMDWNLLNQNHFQRVKRVLENNYE